MKSFLFWSNFTEVCYQVSNWQWTSMVSDNGLVPNRRQAIIGTNVDPIHWRICAALGDELKPRVYVRIWNQHKGYASSSSIYTRWNITECCEVLKSSWIYAKKPGGWFNIKISSYQYRKSHYGDKTILRPSYLHNGISYTGKTTSLYWIKAQAIHGNKWWLLKIRSCLIFET